MGNQGQPEEFVNTAIESFIQTDAVINKGNSGGALVNAKGELIGINSNIMSPSGYYAGYGFAVPVNIVKKIADDFVKFGEVRRGLIGITFRELDAEYAKEVGVDDIIGLYVNEVVENGGAAKAGIRKGDIITKIDDKTIYNSSDLQERVYIMRPGDKVKLTYKRDGREREATVTLQEQPKDTAAEERRTAATASATELYNKLGAGFVPANDSQKQELGVKSGVVVTQVHRGGLFDYYNIQRGLVITQVNGVDVNSIDDVEKALGRTERNIIRIVGIPQRGSRIEFNIPADL